MTVDPCIPIVRADTEGLQRAARLIRAGQVVAFPTETLYGLAVDALRPQALDTLRVMKHRDPARCFPVLISDRFMLERLVMRIPRRAKELMERYWPGPLTLVLPAAPGLPPPLVSERGGIGLRLSSDPVARELVRIVRGPITATSANQQHQPSATTAPKACLDGVALVLDDGPREGVSSTVAEVLGEKVVILRQGALVLEGV